jgi:hypothetical protein
MYLEYIISGLSNVIHIKVAEKRRGGTNDVLNEKLLNNTTIQKEELHGLYILPLESPCILATYVDT